MQILLPVIYFILFIFLILKMKFFEGLSLSKPQLTGLFLLKIIAGLTSYYIYNYYYAHSDSYSYFIGSKNLFDQFLGNSSSSILGWNASFDDTFYNNSRIIIYINFLIQFLSFNNVFVHILFFCFISLVGLTALYKAFYKHFPAKKVILVLGVYLVPSVLFWTSGIYKEGIAFFCIGFVIYLTDFGLEKSFSIKKIICLVLIIALLFFVKVYIAVAVLPLLMINWLVSKTNDKNFLLKYAFLFISFVAVFHLLSKTNNRLNVYQLIADKQAKAISEAQGGIFLANESNFIRLDCNDSIALLSRPDSSFYVKSGSHFLSWKLDNMKDTTFVVNSSDPASYTFLYKIQPANSVLKMQKMNPTFLGVLQKAPFAIVNVFIQPTLFSIKNILQLFSWIENMWLILSLVIAILFFDKKTLVNKEVLLFCLLFALIQFAMIGLTTSSIGAMVRYKVTALPFLFILAMLCIDGEKLLKKLKRTKN